MTFHLVSDTSLQGHKEPPNDGVGSVLLSSLGPGEKNYHVSMLELQELKDFHEETRPGHFPVTTSLSVPFSPTLGQEEEK